MFEPYRETFKANNEHMTMVKSTYANSSLQEFRDAVDKYKGMTDDFEAIPSCATVGGIRTVPWREDTTWFYRENEKLMLGKAGGRRWRAKGGERRAGGRRGGS